MSKLSRLPVTFSETGTLDGKDVRFINVTIDVLHTGDNRNGSTFDKETVDIAANSIKNTPILGYIEQNQVDEKDFKGHEHKLIIDDDGIKYVYAGSAYGVIPESCNPRWIKKCDDKGVEREYFRVDGLLWTKFDDACDIFKRDLQKNHSMEITNIEGYVDDRGYYVVSNFQFDGCCILSTTNPHIQPAMTGSDIVANFTATTIAGQVKEMLDEYSALKSSQSSKEAEINMFAKGEDSLDKKREILESYGVDEADLGFSLEDVTIEELEKKCKELACGSGKKKGKKKDYALNMKDLWNEIEAAVSSVDVTTDEWGYECPRYWMQDIQDDLVVVIDDRDWKLYAFPYTVDGDNVVVDFEGKKRCKVKYELWEDGASEEEEDSGVRIQPIANSFAVKVTNAREKLTAVQGDFEKIQSEFDEMKPKYDAYVAAEAEAHRKEDEQKREKLFQLMDKQIGDSEEYAALKDKKDIEFSALEDECYKILGKKAAEFSYVPSSGKKEDGKDFARFGVSGVQVKTEGRYGDLFERYHVR